MSKIELVEPTDAERGEPAKKRHGWPKGKPRGPRAKASPEAVKAAADRAERPSMMSKMKARPNWDSDDFVGVGLDNVDRLRIPDELVQSLHRDGIALQWVTRSVRGQETPQELSKMTRGGWTPVHQSDFDGLLDGLFMPKGQDDAIGVDDCLLVARPVAIHQKAQIQQSREANSRLRIIEEQLGHGIPNVTGSAHPTVRNSIKKSVERIEVPE